MWSNVLQGNSIHLNEDSIVQWDGHFSREFAITEVTRENGKVTFHLMKEGERKTIWLYESEFKQLEKILEDIWYQLHKID